MWAASSTLDHKWMKLEEKFNALHDRALIDGEGRFGLHAGRAQCRHVAWTALLQLGSAVLAPPPVIITYNRL